MLEAAYGVHMVANATMARAMRSVTIERGRDARNFTVVAFGGSGPCHAAALARQLGIRRVIVPASPGLFSSLGLLSATQEYEFVRSLMLGTRDTNGHSLEESFTVLESEARDILHQEGYAANALGFTRYADLHYAAQIHELTVPVPPSGRISDLEEVFGEEHHRTYGYQSAREPIEITNIRVMGHQIQSLGAQADLTAIGAALYGAGGQSNSRKAYFGKERGLLDVPIISRGDLDLQSSQGPAIVEEYDTTIVVPPGCTVSRDAAWNVILQWEQ